MLLVAASPGALAPDGVASAALPAVSHCRPPLALWCCLLAAAAPGALDPDGALLQPPLALRFLSAVPRCSPPRRPARSPRTVRSLCCCLQCRVAASPLCVVSCGAVLLQGPSGRRRARAWIMARCRAALPKDRLP